MDSNVLTIGVLGVQFMAALATPGVTFWVMRRMTAAFQKDSKEHCVQCKAELERRILANETKEDQIVQRQLDLREHTLPSIRENFVKVSDLDKATTVLKGCITDIKSEMAKGMAQLSSDVRTVHQRVDELQLKANVLANTIMNGKSL